MHSKLELFRNEPGFHKLFLRFADKYRSFGRIGGSVKVNDFSFEELESIAGFLAVSPNFLSEKPVVALKAFESQLAKTNLEGLALKTLLEHYFDEPLISKNEEKANHAIDEADFYKGLVNEHPSLAWWFEKIPTTRFVQVMYKQDKETLLRLLHVVAKAYELLPLPGDFERLPLFAQRVTGNPHFFDRNEPAGKLFLYLLACDYARANEQEVLQWKHTGQINELLLGYGILRDDLWSFVTCRGFIAWKNNHMHKVWQAAVDCETVMNVPVRELVELTSIAPSSGKSVWVVENSGVCSAIMDEVESVAVACTHGQFKVASWVFFDRLIKAGCTIYYAGDMDPEGLLMADKLKNRYPENVVVWRMDVASYAAALSEERIDERMNKLNHIADPELKLTAEAMMKCGRASYQEGLVKLLVGDIRRTVLS